MASRKLASVNKNVCVACGACVAACPKQALSVFRGCYAQTDSAQCVGCGKCAKTCPAGCISIVEREAVQ